MSSRLLKILLTIAVPLIVITLFSGWIMEWLWLSELGYTQVFWTLKSTQIILTLAAFIVAGTYFAINLRHLAVQLKFVNLAGTPFQNVNLDLMDPSQQDLLKKLLTIAALVLSILFALGFYIRWDESLRFLWSVPFGVTDPMFGRDIGYYLFQLPFWQMIQTGLVVISFMMLAILLFIYIFTGLLSGKQGSGIEARPPVLNHISVNGAFWLLMVAWGLFLERHELLYKDDGIVFGAGYTDVHILLPVIWILIGISILLAVALFVSRWTKTGRIIPLLTGVGLIVLVLGRAVIPGMVQKFSVEPNELELEASYLQDNINMTRLAFGLDNVTEVEYQADDTLRFADINNNRDAIDNIRLWDPRLLIQTYKQLQEIRSYYEFYEVDNDRYVVDGQTTQMMVSAREISRELPSQSDTWVNRHMQYTHGFGMAMSPVTETTSQGEPRLIVRDLPPITESPDLAITNPAIYYGEQSSSYYIVNTGVPELHYPAGDENVYNNYDGIGGIQFTNWFRKLLFAWELKDINILLSDYISEDSRLQIWRSVQERIRRITPFLHLDTDPYLVMNDGRFFWIQDAYTTSSHFPYSQMKNGINYIRNSVKIVVDAYDGSVNYYIVDEEDPVLQVYDTIFPDLFKPISELPAGLENHFRYPQDLFEIQIETFNRYHMTTPQVFYNQEDLWTRPNEKYGGQQLIMEPYYILARLPGDDKLEFMLISPLTPENRDNMISWFAAKSDPEEYGKLIVYKLPKDRLIYGPAQIEARIDQDPEISQLLALWDQRGSRVIRGNLMVIPVENSFLYVEPVFLLADGVDIPQLQRVIVAIGDNIAMEPTLDEALFQLFGSAPAESVTQTISAPASSQAPGTTPGTVLPAPTSQELDEIRALWQDIKSAMESGDLTGYGRLLNELDEAISN